MVYDISVLVLTSYHVLFKLSFLNRFKRFLNTLWTQTPLMLVVGGSESYVIKTTFCVYVAFDNKYHGD